MCSPGQSPREQVLAELATLEVAGLPAEELMEHIAGLAAFADQINGELARLTWALDVSGGTGEFGHRSAAAFLRSACGRAPSRASELAAAGRELERLPATSKALAAGEISFDQALAVTRTAADILDPAGAANVSRQAAAQAAAESAERVLLDAAAGAPPGRTGHGQLLTAAQVLALCCGADITAIRWEDGLPLDVGRAARTETPALRKALEARDRTCRWPGCEAPGAWATAHHIRGWAQGAGTSPGEMVLLCHLHHAHFVHLRGWTITGDPGATLHFTHPHSGLTLHSPLPGKPRAP